MVSLVAPGSARRKSKSLRILKSIAEYMGEERHTLYREILKDVSGMYVEVGTCFGGFADFLLKNTACTKLFCIDPYRKFGSDEYKDTLNSYTPDENDMKYRMVFVKLKSTFGDRVEMILTTSVEASQLFGPKSLSVCYIDANHEYEYVRKDILAWLPKVKPGGWICGDDVEPLLPEHEGTSIKTDHGNGVFNYCGVHSALVSLKKEMPWFDYKIVGTQWIFQVSEVFAV